LLLILGNYTPKGLKNNNKQAPSKIVRHSAINDIIAQSLASAGIPASKEPTGLTRLDGKRPDSITLVPWQCGKPTVSTLAKSYLHASSHLAGGAAELATSWKEAKYASLSHNYLFQPVALETLGSIATSSSDFLCEVARRLSAATGNVHDMAYLFQRLSIAIQCYNSVLIYKSFAAPDAKTDN